MFGHPRKNRILASALSLLGLAAVIDRDWRAWKNAYRAQGQHRRRNRGTGIRFSCEGRVAIVSALLSAGLSVNAQYSAPATPAPYNPIALAEITEGPKATVHAGQNSNQIESQSPFLGGVPAGVLSATSLDLTLEDAVNRGLKQNLGVVLASDAEADSAGQKWQALSELLPDVVTDSGIGVHQIKLKAAIGLSIPGVTPTVGPFGYFDARAYLKQSAFDWESIERVRASQAQLRSAQYGAKDARELVVLVIVSNYLLTVADQSEVESAGSERDTARRLLQQSSDQKVSGLASAVDVLRAQVELQSREQKLIVAQNALAKEKLVLARAVGLPPGQQFVVTTKMDYHDLSAQSLDEAIASAYEARADYQSEKNEVRSAELEKKAASAERYPSLGVEADYGVTGVNAAESHGTVDAAATLRVPIFQGGRVHGDVLRAEAQLNISRERLDDLRARIDVEVRSAYLDLEATAQEVSVEKSAVGLASETLEQSRDRFGSGVTDNIEVIQAQDALAIANDAYIASLYSFNLAKITLARVTGVAEARYADYLKGK